jgi:hypothetical protein
MHYEMRVAASFAFEFYPRSGVNVSSSSEMKYITSRIRLSIKKYTIYCAVQKKFIKIARNLK